MSIRLNPNREGEAPAELNFDGIDLPEGWATCKLMDVGQIITGNTPPRNNTNNYGRAFPWVKPPDLGTDVPITTTAECLSEVGAGLARLLPPESVLVSCIGLLGKVGIAGTTLATNQQINAVVFDERIVLPKFGFHFCKTLRPWMEENASSTTVAIINKGRLSEAPLVIAPLAEQRRIVAKLEELLGRVSRAKARLDRIPLLLKRFRQSVLAAACSGKLTSDWREENELESGIVDHAETGSRVPSNWKSDFLGNVARFIDYRGRTPQKADAGIPLITAKNIRPGYIDREPREFIKSEEYERWMTRGIPRIGDVLVTTEAPLGYAASVDLEGRFALAQRVICLQFSEPRNQEFALLYIMSPMFQAMLIEQATGTTVSGIKASRLKQLTMLIPPLSEQHEIVRRVEQLFAVADQIEARLAKAQAQVDRLTQSILAKAFRGELVPTEAELARREGRDYEPASKLLERIRTANTSFASANSTSKPKRKMKSRGE